MTTTLPDRIPTSSGGSEDLVATLTHIDGGSLAGVTTAGWLLLPEEDEKPPVDADWTEATPTHPTASQVAVEVPVGPADGVGHMRVWLKVAVDGQTIIRPAGVVTLY